MTERRADGAKPASSTRRLKSLARFSAIAFVSGFAGLSAMSVALTQELDDREPRYRYIASFVCGPSSENFQEGVVTGSYDTLVTILNPTSQPVVFEKRIARSLPFQAAGASTDFPAEIVGSGEAIAVECDEIRSNLPLQMTRQMRNGFIQFVADSELVVSATYSARPRIGSVSSTDILHITAETLPPERSIFESSDLCRLMEQSASLIEGHIRDISFTFDPQIGPRETIVLGDVTTHFGSDVGAEVTIKNLRGPVPDTTEPEFIEIPQLPRFTREGHYFVYLTRQDWFYSPVTLDAAFRVEQIGDREVLIDQSGHALNPSPTENAFLAGEAVNPDSVFAPRPLVLKQVFGTRIDLDDINAPQPLLAGIDQSTVENAFDRSGYLDYLQSEMDDCHKPFEGETPPQPAGDRTWDRIGFNELMDPQEDTETVVPCGGIDPETGATRICSAD